MNLTLLDAELRRDEGVRYVRYLDSRGIPSTGVGHNLVVSPLPVGWAYPLTDAQVDQLLNQDVSTAMHELDTHLPWWRKLDEVRQRVIVNMCFNLGIAKLLTFKNAMAAIQRGAYAAAAAEMKNSDWFEQVGARAVRLCQAMLSGVMPSAQDAAR